MEVKLTCPLGHTCERAVDGHIERCAWYTQLEGTNPQNGDKVDKWGCAIAWQPLLMVELSAQQNQTGASIQSMRNTMDKRQKEAIALARGIKNVPVLSNS